MSESNSSRIKTAVRVAAAILILIAVIFGPAGTFNWPEAWCFLFLYFLYVGVMGVWMKKNDPELLKERMSAKKKNNVKGWDKWLMGTFTLLTLALFAAAGLDAVRFRWSQVPFAFKVPFYALIPAVLSIILFFFRTSLEDKTLMKELPGCEEYARKVQYKLIPGVW